MDQLKLKSNVQRAARKGKGAKETLPKERNCWNEGPSLDAAGFFGTCCHLSDLCFFSKRPQHQTGCKSEKEIGHKNKTILKTTKQQGIMKTSKHARKALSEPCKTTNNYIYIEIK